MPSYFRSKGWFKPKKDDSHVKRLLFITWAFSRCRASEHKVFHDNKDIILKPYQFIFGHFICMEETGLSFGEVRQQSKNLIKHGFLKNATNRTTKRYSVHEWLPEAFCESNNKENNKVTTKRQQSDNNKTDIHISDSKVVDVCDLFVRAHEEKEKEEMQSPLLVFQHRKQNTISIRKTDLILELKNMESPFTDDEIEEGIKVMQENNPILNSNIQKYIIGIIEKKRKQQSMEIRSNSYGRKTNQQDLVSRSSGSIKEPAIYIKGQKV
jgi:hypothetical protein